MADTGSGVVVSLSPRSTVEAELVRDDVRRLLDHVTRRECIAVAAVVIYADGTTGVQTRGRGNRTLLLGAVTDLQFSIAKDGDGG